MSDTPTESDLSAPNPAVACSHFGVEWAIWGPIFILGIFMNSIGAQESSPNAENRLDELTVFVA